MLAGIPVLLISFIARSLNSSIYAAASGSPATGTIVGLVERQEFNTIKVVNRTGRYFDLSILSEFAVKIVKRIINFVSATELGNYDEKKRYFIFIQGI
jgi:hypothetical protein